MKWVCCQHDIHGYQLTSGFSGDDLSSYDKHVLCAFAYKVRSQSTKEAFNMLPSAFPDIQLPSLKQTRARVAFLAGLSPARYDCCINSCCCFVGPIEDLDRCPHCSAPCRTPSGLPQKQFTYIPIIPHLVALYANRQSATEMRYRTRGHSHQPGNITDMFDGSLYQKLLAKKVSVNGHELAHNHFSDLRDIALGLATDSFAPF
ncbi:uncharacterized protein F5891DRAFT_965740 [Suillus fuscotomentosus]|uniref:Uncharacterized protein n=1 Tax=Suillus fuscotomentosus TaxID=1912939 RepID=A0AAD4DPZ5_9AGAM|nr:uncharacterized protein F5891DRAFT_965740 [Suillus fuscotomentosus]KAG1889030.1 hypothetical protein F5891DRAFT_965740 [Suillus fuscotomentosus]